jgi:hypothetical protein
MNDDLESRLERLRPAKLPSDLMARLTAARPQAPAPKPRPTWWRWLAPAFAATVAIVVHFRTQLPEEVPASLPAQTAQIISRDTLISTRDVGVILSADQQPYRLMELQWFEERELPGGANAAQVQVAQRRHQFVPVALEIY